MRLGSELRNSHAHIGEARAEDRGAARDDLHALALEAELADDVADARPAGGVIEHALLHARAHLKLAARRIAERKLAQVAAHTHAHVARLARDDGLGDPA